MSSNGACSCSCKPCSCPCPPGLGCVEDMCVPRPCFFNGQLVTSDDLNAVVSYFKSRDAMLSRFDAGWGVLGGLRADAAPGVPKAALVSNNPFPNPQILAGTSIQVSPGAAIDAAGRALVLCAPQILDIQKLMAEVPSAPITQTCNAWFSPLPGVCGAPPLTNGLPEPTLTATEYWLIAEHTESPARPVPRYAGGGPCDPAPACDFSRKMEGVRFRLIKAIPTSYFMTGCLDNIELPPQMLLVRPVPGGGFILGTGGGGSGGSGGTPELCIYNQYAIFDAVTSMIAANCCTQPAVVVARLLVTSGRGALGGSSLPSAPLYVIMLDGYPFRRIVLPNALLSFAFGSSGCAPREPTGTITLPNDFGDIR